MNVDFRAEPELMDRMTLSVMPCFAIYSASNALMRFYRKALADVGLTYPQLLVMMALWESKGMTMKALGERVGLESSTLTPLVKKLEGEGLLTRARNREDERLLDIAPTAKGMEMRPDGCEAAFSMVGASGETLESIQELAGRLRRIAAQLSAHAAGDAMPDS